MYKHHTAVPPKIDSVYFRIFRITLQWCYRSAMVAQITSISVVCPTGKLWANNQENIELRISDCLWRKFIGDWRISSQMVIDNAESVSMPPGSHDIGKYNLKCWICRFLDQICTNHVALFRLIYRWTSSHIEYLFLEYMFTSLKRILQNMQKTQTINNVSVCWRC